MNALSGRGDFSKCTTANCFFYYMTLIWPFNFFCFLKHTLSIYLLRFNFSIALLQVTFSPEMGDINKQSTVYLWLWYFITNFVSIFHPSKYNIFEIIFFYEFNNMIVHYLLGNLGLPASDWYHLGRSEVSNCSTSCSLLLVYMFLRFSMNVTIVSVTSSIVPSALYQRSQYFASANTVFALNSTWKKKLVNFISALL